MKSFLKIAVLFSLMGLASCSHHGKYHGKDGKCDMKESKCDMKEGKCEMKEGQCVMKKEAA